MNTARTPSGRREHSPPGRPGPLRRLCAALLALLAATVTAPEVRAREAVLDLATYPKGEVTIETVKGARHGFRVWIADTSERQSQGLMYVRDLPADQGMLFVNRPARPASFWMKNTYIPLDMVFVSRDGVVTIVAPNAKPMSEETIPGGMAYGVIELNAGVAEKIGLKPGDTVRHPAFRH